MKTPKNNTASSANSTLGIGIVTPAYDLLVDLAGWGTDFQKKLVDISAIKPRERLADIGSGTGTFCILAKRARRTAKIAGIDPDAGQRQIFGL
jgi:ubiquinone/menaquinone biosynthesis C-methylase UbiE